MVWIVSGLLFLIWAILKFAFNRAGFVHVLLIAAISVFVVQLTAYRKTKYHERDE